MQKSFAVSDFEGAARTESPGKQLFVKQAALKMKICLYRRGARNTTDGCVIVEGNAFFYERNTRTTESGTV